MGNLTGKHAAMRKAVPSHFDGDSTPRRWDGYPRNSSYLLITAGLIKYSKNRFPIECRIVRPVCLTQTRARSILATFCHLMIVVGAKQ
mgnify:CR=1 FL=1